MQKKYNGIYKAHYLDASYHLHYFKNMENTYTSVEQLIGKTPLLELTHIEKELGLKARVLAKLDMFNPTGSAKDRAAAAMLDKAEKDGIIKAGATIIEPTSGNTGIGLAAVGAVRGYRVIIVMPDSMSVERQKLMTAFGAELVLTPGAEGMKGAIQKAEELASSIPGSFIPDQFNNKANADAHYLTTGPEIFADTEGKVDWFVAGVGTGGTITGTGRFLKEKIPGVKIAAVEPATSPLISKGYAGSHGLQGIGANFIPSILDTKLLDEVITVTDDDAYSTGRMLCRKEGILAGITSGASLWAAIQIAKRPENEGKTIVAFLTDTGTRYLSTPLYNV